MKYNYNTYSYNCKYNPSINTHIIVCVTIDILVQKNIILPIQMI